MALFVNREKELDLLENAVQALLDRQRLLRTPIIEIYGVGGMGKTALLKQMELYCQEKDVLCLSLDLRQIVVSLEEDLIVQINLHLDHQNHLENPSVIQAADTLLKKRPVVMLFDAVDVASTEQQKVLRELLHELIDQEKLVVVLASKKTLPFLQKEQNVARRLTPFSLQSLSREHCEHFLINKASQVEAEIRELIFEWTRGYPLAMSVMIEAIQSGLDTHTEQGRREILTKLKNQVIYQEILGDIETEKKRAYYYTALQLFSIPRRFSIVLMQDLIEAFSPALRRDGVLAYLSLPKNINEATHAMHWDMGRAGYAVDAPVRTLFLLILKQEQPELYFAIHTFLAKKNRELAQEVSGTDRIRCLSEYLYHLAHSQTSSEQALTEVTEMVSRETPEAFVQFAEEFTQDYELKEALGQHLSVVEATIHGYLEKDREGEE